MNVFGKPAQFDGFGSSSMSGYGLATGFDLLSVIGRKRGRKIHNYGVVASVIQDTIANTVPGYSINPLLPTYAVLWVASNDILAGDTNDVVESNVVRLTDLLTAKGVRGFFFMTPQKRTQFTAPQEQQRKDFNSWLRANPPLNTIGIADIGGTAATQVYTSVYQADNIHLNEAGHRLAACLLEPILKRIH